MIVFSWYQYLFGYNHVIGLLLWQKAIIHCCCRCYFCCLYICNDFHYSLGNSRVRIYFLTKKIWKTTISQRLISLNHVRNEKNPTWITITILFPASQSILVVLIRCILSLAIVVCYNACFGFAQVYLTVSHHITCNWSDVIAVTWIRMSQMGRRRW